MIKGITSLINSYLDWKEVSDRVMELSKDQSRIEEQVNDQMMEVIKELHPQDYQEFIEKNKNHLEEIKRKLRTRYSSEIKDRIIKFLDPVRT
jgi:hypothetical protein